MSDPRIRTALAWLRAMGGKTSPARWSGGAAERRGCADAVARTDAMTGKGSQ